jgi:hypothetical protein
MSGGPGRLIDDLPRAANLFGAIETLLDNIGVPLAPADQQDYERDRDRVCSQPGVKCFAAPDEEKRFMTLQEAVAYARDYTQEQSPLN